MIIKNGPFVIVLGAFLSVVAGGIGYYCSHESLLITLIAAVVPLFLCTLFANFVYLGGRNRAAAAVAATSPSPPSPVAAPTAVIVAPPSRQGILRSAFFYLTLGTLTVIWSGLWYWYLGQHAPTRDYVWYICEGLILTGLLVMGIGGLIYRLRYHLIPRGSAQSVSGNPV